MKKFLGFKIKDWFAAIWFPYYGDECWSVQLIPSITIFYSNDSFGVERPALAIGDVEHL